GLSRTEKDTPETAECLWGEPTMSITAFATRRARTLRLAAAGLTAVAALTLTACNSNEGTGTKSEAPAEHNDQRLDVAGGAKKGSDNSEQEIGPCDINKLTVGVKSVAFSGR
ncbi:hypothetical protein AB4Z54_75555, partial [Streptomyces sp. MCAF7]